jgi:hypothetical protein
MLPIPTKTIFTTSLVTTPQQSQGQHTKKNATANNRTPGGQRAHEPAPAPPSTVEYVPIEQLVQDTAPDKLHVPAPHNVGWDSPELLQTEPVQQAKRKQAP